MVDSKVKGKQLPVESAAFMFVGAWLSAEKKQVAAGHRPLTAHAQCPLQSLDPQGMGVLALARADCCQPKLALTVAGLTISLCRLRHSKRVLYKHRGTLAIITAVDGLIDSEGFKDGFALAQTLAC